MASCFEGQEGQQQWRGGKREITDNKERKEKVSGGGGSHLELLHQLPGVGRVEQVDVSGLAVDHGEWERVAEDGGNARGLLLRVAAVLERVLRLVDTRGDRGVLLELGGEVSGDRRVVRGRGGVSASGEALPQGQGGAAVVGLHGFEKIGVLGGGSDDGGERVVLGGRAQHGGPAYVNVLDALLEGGTLGDCGLKGVQVENGHVNDPNVIGDHVLLVLLVAPNGE